MSTVEQSDTFREGRRLLDAMGKYGDVIMSAYLATEGGILPNDSNSKAIEALCRYRLMQQDDIDGVFRLRVQIRNLLAHGLSTIRLHVLNVDIANAIEGIKQIAGQYRDALQRGDMPSAEGLLLHLRDNVNALCDSIADQTRDIWVQINSNFGAVSRLSDKLKLNESAITRVNDMLSAIGLIDMTEVMELCRRDDGMQAAFQNRLQRAIERSLQDLTDAINRLNAMMFDMQQLERSSKNVALLAEHFRANPQFRPADYVESADVPELFMLASHLKPGFIADVKSDGLELELTQLLSGLRKQADPDEIITRTEPLNAVMTEQPVVDFEDEGLRSMVRQLFVECLESGEPIRALDRYDAAVMDDDAGAWLYTVLSVYYAMESELGEFLSLETAGDWGAVISGNKVVEDIVLWPSK